MELSDAVDKAYSTMESWGLALTQSRTSLEIDRAFLSEFSYQQSIEPFIKKCGDKVAENVDEFIPGDDVLEKDGLGLSSPSRSTVGDRLVSEATKMCFPVFAMGWVLGAPEWDARPHNRETYVAALRDQQDAMRILVNRFSAEYFLHEKFEQKALHGGGFLAEVFGKMQLPQNKRNVKKWCRLTTALAMYEAFQVGLRTRRVVEEDAAIQHLTDDFKD